MPESKKHQKIVKSQRFETIYFLCPDVSSVFFNLNLDNNVFLAIIEGFKTWRHYLKVMSMRLLFLQTTTIFTTSQMKKVWVLNRSTRPKSSFNIIFGSIIVRVKLTELQILCFTFHSEVPPFKPQLLLQKRTYHFYTKFSSENRIFDYIYVNIWDIF